jgi:excisionase family DNA binding protein
MERYLTRRGAGDFLRLNERTIDRLVAAGRLLVVKIGRSVRIRQSDFEALIASNAAIRA